MASLMISSVAPVTCASPAQTNMIAPFTGLKSLASFSVIRKAENDITSITSNGGRVQCMKGVVSVFPNFKLKIHTTRSWDFLGVPIKYY